MDPIVYKASRLRPLIVLLILIAVGFLAFFALSPLLDRLHNMFKFRLIIEIVVIAALAFGAMICIIAMFSQKNAITVLEDKIIINNLQFKGLTLYYHDIGRLEIRYVFKKLPNLLIFLKNPQKAQPKAAIQRAYITQYGTPYAIALSSVKVNAEDLLREINSRLDT